MDKPKTVAVTISTKTVVRVLLIIAAAYIFLRFVIKVDHVLELIFLSLFLSVALNPAVSWISTRLRIKSRLLATGIAYLAVVLVLVAFFSLVIPPLVNQTATFVKSLPSTIRSLEDSASPAGKFVRHYNLGSQANDIGQYINQHITKISGPVLSTANRVWDGVVATITVFVLTFMMLVEGPVWIQRYWRLTIFKKTTKEHNEMFERMYKIVTGYVNGQVLLALVGGGFTLLALEISSHIIGASVNSIALAGIVVLTGLIPLIGHLIGGSVVVVACLFVSLPLAIIMAVFLVVYQWIENMTFQPYIQSKYNELSPLLVIVAALIGVGAGGIIGAFVAIPAAGIAKVLVKEYLQEKKMIV